MLSDMPVVKAFGDHYFEHPELPVRISHVNRALGITHPHDLTDIEHVHDFIEIVVIMGGTGTQVIRGEAYPVVTGDVFVLQGHQSHYFSDCASVDIINVMFDPIRRPDLLLDGIGQMQGFKALFVLEPGRRNQGRFGNLLRLDAKSLQEADSLISRIRKEMTNRRDGHDLMVFSLLHTLLILLSREYVGLHAPNAIALLRIQKAIDYLETAYRLPIHVDELAKMVCMSPRHFQRIFKSATGKGPNGYLLWKRTREAVKLLQSTSWSIDRIAEETGFDDIHYFSRVMRKMTGMSPIRHRKGL
jgi:AraC-like DNA-binding protein